MISPSSPWFTSYGAGTDGRNDDLFRANFFPLHSSAILTLYHKDHARDSARSTKAASIKPLIELLSREEEESLGLGFLSVLCFVVIQRFERQRFPPFLHLHLSFSGQKGRQITSFPPVTLVVVIGARWGKGLGKLQFTRSFSSFLIFLTRGFLQNFREFSPPFLFLLCLISSFLKFVKDVFIFESN